MKIIPFDKVVCRTPAFGVNDNLTTSFEELKLKIKESSPAFFEFIKSIDPNRLDQLEDKTRFTLWKYFNRSKYRATPFGSFAAITIIPLKKGDTTVKLYREMDIDHFINWSCKDDYPAQIKLKKDMVFISNSSVYSVGNELRYVRVKNDQNELVAINSFPELQFILQTCRKKSDLASIQKLMKNKFDISETSTIKLITQLLDLQLIISSNFPNITGEDYFERIEISKHKSAQDYIIAKRKINHGGFSQEILARFPQLITFLAQQFPRFNQDDLNIFKQNFKRRFEHQEVNLAQLMDPEVGIGYGNLAQSEQQNILVNEIKQAKPIDGHQSLRFDSFHTFLLNKIVEGKDFQLDEFISATKPEEIQIPNTLSYIFHLYEGKPVISYAGGCSATALIGRFTMGNQEMENYAKDIAAHEMMSNPDVAFFDVAYQAEKRVDNVNRRKIIYPYELPILTWSTFQDPLDLQDIYVSVVEDEVILRSKKLGKRIIPRIPSAYNYTRSDLSVFRFLCDVQTQGLAMRFSLKLDDIFPKLKYYPRMNFHELIVSPAMWLVPKNIYTDGKNPLTQQIKNLKSWLNDQQIAKFKAGHADSTLCFDVNFDEDLWAFLRYCKNQHHEIYIAEALINTSSCISDQHGIDYLPQYIANFYHQETIYQAYAPILVQSTKDCMQIPGGDWLYYELYTTISLSNKLLLNEISEFLKLHRLKIKKWFFIRYNSPSSHIRFRFQLKNKMDGFELMGSFKDLLDSEIKLGRLSNVEMKTYQQESDRYGAGRMDLVEDFFELDSKIVLYLIKKSCSEQQLITNSLYIISSWLDQWLKEITVKLNYLSLMAESFAKEMEIGPAVFKKINLNFNNLKEQLDKLQFALPNNLLRKQQILIDKLIATCESRSVLEKLLADLIHMHVNRLFTTDQRIYETIIYHYLYRLQKIKQARKTA